MNLTNDIIKYKIIPTDVIDWSQVKKIKTLLQNELYEKYKVEVLIRGDMIVCNDISKIKVYSKKIKKETYQEYLEKIQLRPNDKDQWIYNIIDGISEQDQIIIKDEKCICIPSYTWDGKCNDKLHILCFPIDKTLRCIRSLDISHVKLLEHMKNVSLLLIKEKYGLDEGDLKIFFHYDPSTYHLHIHFVNVEHSEMSSSVEYSHEINSVIFNLLLDSNYYKTIILNTR